MTFRQVFDTREGVMMRVKKGLYLGCLVGGAVIAAGVFLWMGRDSDVGQSLESPGIYRAAPLFELKDSDGKTHRLADWKGKTVILHFWASWCGPCLEEIHQWTGAARRSTGKPIQWVAVSLDKNWKDAQKVLPRESLPNGVISVLDADGELADQYGSFQFPETYILGPDLKILHKWVGPQEWESPRITRLLEEIANATSSSPS